MLRVNVWGNIEADDTRRHGHAVPKLSGYEQAQTGDLLPSPISDNS